MTEDQRLADAVYAAVRKLNEATHACLRFGMTVALSTIEITDIYGGSAQIIDVNVSRPIREGDQ